MNCRKVFLRVLPVVLLVAFLGCGEKPGEPTSANSKPIVYVVNYPLAFFARRIGGEHVDVEFPLPRDIDPAFWKPTDEDIQAFQSADLILINGAEYAKWTKHVTLPASRILNTSKTFEDDLMTVDDVIVHRHGRDGEHAHGSIATHTWLDPKQAILQSESMTAEFSRRWPEHAEDFQANLASLTADLNQLDSSLSEVTKRLDGFELLASHPVYHYLARRCEWDVASFHWEPGEMPSADQWKKLDEYINEAPGEYLMLWEDTPTNAISKELKRRKIEIAVFRPCGNAPATRDYLDEMQANVQRLTKSLDD